MRSGRRMAALALLLAVCTGCAKRHAIAPPQPQAEAPSLPTPAETARLIPPLPEQPSEPGRSVILNTTVPPPAETEHKTHHPVRRRARPAESASTTQPAESKAPAETQNTNQQVAASGEPTAASPIGQLSATGNTSPVDRTAILKLIDSTDDGLKAIKHPLGDSEQKVVAQIRTFLEHARASLKSNDLEGADTLAKKAQLLLETLTNPKQ